MKRFFELFDKLNVVRNNLMSLALSHSKQFPRASASQGGKGELVAWPVQYLSATFALFTQPPAVPFIFVRLVARGIEAAESRSSN